LEGFQERFNETIEGLNTEYGITEQDMRSAFRSSLFQQKIINEVVGEVECTEEQVWAAHILVDDENLAEEIKSRLEDGEEWALMVSTFSTDVSNKNSAGDLGWFGKGTMVAEFEEAVFGMEIGEISEPVETQFGWHIIQKIGHEDKPVSNEGCQQIRFEELNKWLEIQRENSDVVIHDYWGEYAPDEPSLPIEMKQFINLYTNQNFSATPPSP
jgi:parvulin-like peptidyl-prolyl isomerase